MIAITLADLRYRYRQFLIAVLGGGVVLAMAILLSGLANGFKTEINTTIGAVGADRWVMSEKANGRVASVATFDQDAAAQLAGQAGVRAADPLIMLPQEVLRDGARQVTVNVLGVRPGGLGAPRPRSGAALSAAGEVVLDARAHIPVGTQVSLGSTSLRVVGTVSGRTLTAGIPLAYLTLADAQTALLGGQPVVTAVVTAGVPGSLPAGLAAFTPAEVEQHSLTTLASGVSSINKSRTMMWVVAAIIIAALVYVSALQRVRDFAVLKALGSSSAALFGSLCLQAVLVTLLAAGFGTVLSFFLTGVFNQPLSVPASAYTSLPLVALVVGVVASLVALRRATSADPVAAFGG